MDKQEEIREGIQPWVDNRFGKGNLFNTQVLYDFLSYLHSQGVVIKVDRELPEPTICAFTIMGEDESPRNWSAQEISLATQKDMIGDGYVAVEPLIKEE